MTKSKVYKNIFDFSIIAGLILFLSACSSMQPAYQAPPPVKVITEQVQLEIYQPPLPQEIQMRELDLYVITNTPCKPATGEHKNPKYYTTERFAYEDYTKEDGTSARRVQRDAEGNRIELPQLLDENGKGIEVCGNLEQKIAEIEKRIGGDFVIMGMTIKGYENMAFNLQEIKRYINQQKEIILYYREATNASSNDADDWLEKNTQEQADQIKKSEDNNTQQEAPATPPQEEGGFNLKSLLPGFGKGDD